MSDILNRLDALRRLQESPRPRSALESACIDRLIRDFEGIGGNGLVWNEDEANRNVEFCKLLRHWKGEWGRGGGQRFEPEPWQEHLVLAPLFGWYRETDEGLRRRFNNGYIEIPRKNGKTLLCAMVALQGLAADHEEGGEVYLAASTREQAGPLFRDVMQMTKRSPELLQYLDPKAHVIFCPPLNGFLQAVSAEAHTLHGRNISRAVIDELHAQPSRDLWDVIQTGTPGRTNPLVLSITTAGHDRSTICWEQREYSRQILEGHLADESYFSFIACADLEDDPYDPVTWAKANPNLGISPKMDYMRREATKAKASPSYENTFRRLHLNQWTEQAIRWLPMHIWDECAGPVKFSDPEFEAEMLGRECYAGLDLASTRDVNSLVLAFPLDDGAVRVLPFFWVPEDAHDERAEQDRRQVKNWMQQDLIQGTSGNVVDINQIVEDIGEILTKFQVVRFLYDPWGPGEAIRQRIIERGYPENQAIQFKQTISSFAGPTKEFERLVAAKKLQHGGNPVLRWMASNVAVWMDRSGNIRPDKEKSSDKIDGIVAGIQAIGGMLMEREHYDWYQPGSLAL